MKVKCAALQPYNVEMISCRHTVLQQNTKQNEDVVHQPVSFRLNKIHPSFNLFTTGKQCPQVILKINQPTNLQERKHGALLHRVQAL